VRVTTTIPTTTTASPTTSATNEQRAITNVSVVRGVVIDGIGVYVSVCHVVVVHCVYGVCVCYDVGVGVVVVVDVSGVVCCDG